MCCCIPLRRLSYLGAIFHMGLGLLFLYYLGSVSYTLYIMRDKIHSRPRLIMGLFYMAYYAAFLPPGIFIFWGVHKKIRCYLVAPSICFFIVQAYSIGIVSYFGYRTTWLPDAIEKFNSSDVKKLKEGFWMEIFTQISVTIVYLFMLFFYYREIGPESNPVQSRYAQAYLQDPMNPMNMNPPHPHQHQHPSLNPQHLAQTQQLGPPVPFRPVTLAHGQGPHSLAASNTNLNRNSTPCPPLNLNLGALNLTYEQQQQLIKLQQHPLILQQLQQQQQLQESLHHHQLPHQHQHQHHQQHQHHPHQHQHHQEQQDQQLPHPLFHSYAQMLASDPNKTPKF